MCGTNLVPGRCLFAVIFPYNIGESNHYFRGAVYRNYGGIDLSVLSKQWQRAVFFSNLIKSF
jgi:hypothetical protein